MNQGIAGSIVAAVLAVALLYRGKRIQALVWGIVLLSLFATRAANNSLARRRANMIVTACEHYRAQHGRYPTQLQDLVPSYLPEVPPSDFGLANNRFMYLAGFDGQYPKLIYLVLPPFGRAVYDFKTKSWNDLD